MKPDFMIIGAAKAGTTTLYDDLAALPGAFMPTDKEPDILHRAKNAVDAVKRYEAHFAGASTGDLCGEGSTYYTMSPTFPCVAPLAREVCGPDLKLLYITRDPVARIKSHLAHDFAVGRISSTDFDEAVHKDPRYLAWSDYALQLNPWREAFGEAAILVLTFETFIKDRTQVVAAACRHIGLEAPKSVSVNKVSNGRGSQAKSRVPWISSVLASDLYRNRLRRLMPVQLRDVGKSLFMSKSAVPDIELRAETEIMVRERCAYPISAFASGGS